MGSRVSYRGVLDWFKMTGQVGRGVPKRVKPAKKEEKKRK